MECHKLDLLLASQSQGALVGADPSFEDHVDLIREWQGLREVEETQDMEAVE